MPLKRTLLLVAILALMSLLLWRWLERPPAAPASEITVPVARVQRGDLGDTLQLAGAFKPFQDVEVHAKVAGYIRKINVDVGDRVKQGQVLAILEVPELAAQLTGAEASVRAAQEQIRRAQGDVQRARSTHSAAHSAYTRLRQAADTQAGLVAQQELDDSQAKDLESEGQLSSSEAALSAAQQQLHVAEAAQKQVAAMSDYTRIVAPFDGVVTVRSADTGALVAAGTSESTQAIPVVRLVQTTVLRLVLPVPESIAAAIRVGQPMDVHVPALDKTFPGKVARFADSLNEQTRTMETEIDVANRDNTLLPGMYADVAIALNQQHAVLYVPLEAVLHTDKGPEVLVVNPQNLVEPRQVSLGYEGSTRVVVLAGLQEGEHVIVGARSDVTPGQMVIPRDVTSPANVQANDSQPGAH